MPMTIASTQMNNSQLRKSEDTHSKSFCVSISLLWFVAKEVWVYPLDHSFQELLAVNSHAVPISLSSGGHGLTGKPQRTQEAFEANTCSSLR